jgi:hypothetical protein
MTPPPASVLSAWHRRFRDRQSLWAGHIRIWRVELPVYEPATSGSLLATWLKRAHALDDHIDKELSHRLGLPEHVVKAILADAVGGIRRSFAWLDLPSGVVQVSSLNEPLSARPHPIEPRDVPAAILRPSGVSVVPVSGDWRTIPVVHADTLPVVAIRGNARIDVYAVGPEGTPGGAPISRLQEGALNLTDVPTWKSVWRDWCRENGVDGATELVAVERGVGRVQGGNAISPDGAWIWAGDGPLREGLLVVPSTSP